MLRNFFNPTKTGKYKNKKVEYNGIIFDSKKEMSRYVFLKEMEDKGLISNLERQERFCLIPTIKEDYEVKLKTKIAVKTRTVQLAITYTCDFTYMKDGVKVVEDVKASPKSASLDKVFLIKEKLFRWKYGYSIKRVYKANEEI
jgi:hypothetical protein